LFPDFQNLKETTHRKEFYMKFTLHPLAAATLAATACNASFAAAVVDSQPQVLTDTRTIVIENGVVTESTGGTGGMAPEIFIAQADGDKVKKEVKIVTSGSLGSLGRLHDLPDIDMLVSNAMSEAYAGAAHGGFGKTVKNAPYSAEIITEKNQMLPDGNQITKRTSMLTFRDSAGRTRQETRDAKGEVKSIHVHDAVDGTRYVISPSTKSATKMSIDKEFNKHIAEIKDKAKAMAKNAKDSRAVIVEHPGPGQEIIVKRIEGPAGEGKKEVREEVKVNVVRSGGSGGPGHGNTNVQTFSFGDGDFARAFGDSMRLGPIGMSFQDGKWSSKTNVTQLGTKDIEGVRAEGKSTSYTIPAGEIGNKNPITVTTETWYSPELQATVYSKSSDPRVGETIYRLANVKRSEPAQALFAVPEGYTVKDLPGFSFSTKTN
jgi:hypothetical protein